MLAASHGILLAGIALLAPVVAADAEERTVYMAAVELKGATTVDKEPFPAGALPPGAGYVKKAPDATGRWEVSVYQFAPATVVVQQGDRVTLEIIGINGAIHNVHIDRFHPDHVAVKRGQIARVRFTADAPGLYRIHCLEHPPSMVGYLVVLPR
jgi:plastocyanin